MSIAHVNTGSSNLKLNEWWNAEFRVPILRSSKFINLDGLKEYRVKVSSQGITSERLVCKVKCIDTKGNAFDRWVDEITGSFYSLEGQCLSSERIKFASHPNPTGRAVPSIFQRAVEGNQKSLLYRYGVEDEE